MVGEKIMKNKAAELTIPTAENYGSVLQAYALRSFLEEEGYDVDVINYEPEYLKNRYSLFKIDNSSFIKCFKTFISSSVNFYNKVLKKVRFRGFQKKYIGICNHKLDNIKELERYNTVFVGGDQLWNTRITNYNTDFFLDKLDIKNKIGFSVSMGYNDRTVEEVSFYKKYINNFNYIYVRENTDVGFLNSISTLDNINYVLDPTLLVEKDIWIKLAKRSKRVIHKKYILVYIFNQDKNSILLIKKIGDTLRLPVYIIKNAFRKYDENGFINIKCVGPLQFVNLFSNAEYIVTNSFHGTAFSIIFEKNFNCIPYSGTENRMISLLNILKLQKALNNEMNIFDYSSVNSILDIERKRAREIIGEIKGQN